MHVSAPCFPCGSEAPRPQSCPRINVPRCNFWPCGSCPGKRLPVCRSASPIHEVTELLLSVPPGRPLEDQVRLRIALFNLAAGWCHPGLETYIRTHSPIPHPGYFCHFQGASGFLPLPGTLPLPDSLSATLPQGRPTQGLSRDEGVDGTTGTAQCGHETSLSFRACWPR